MIRFRRYEGSKPQVKIFYAEWTLNTVSFSVHCPSIVQNEVFALMTAATNDIVEKNLNTNSPNHFFFVILQNVKFHNMTYLRFHFKRHEMRQTHNLKLQKKKVF